MKRLSLLICALLLCIHFTSAQDKKSNPKTELSNATRSSVATAASTEQTTPKKLDNNASEEARLKAKAGYEKKSLNNPK